jgi:hypothetical protein
MFHVRTINMQVYLCKAAYWQAVLDTRLYYISELRLAVNIKGKNFPNAGDTVQFLSNRVLGTAVIQESYQNGYAGHFVLRDINDLSGDHVVGLPKSTDILRDASAEVAANIDGFLHDLFLIDEEQQAMSTRFASLESRKTNITRRIAGKSVQLMEKAPRKRKASAVTGNKNKKMKSSPMGDVAQSGPETH